MAKAKPETLLVFKEAQKLALRNVNLDKFKIVPYYPNIAVSEDNEYIFINPQRSSSVGVKKPASNRLKNGHLCSLQVCVGYRKDAAGKQHPIVHNFGKLVLWANGIFEPDDVQIEVDHIDRNPANNHLTNLRWASRCANVKNRDFTNIISRHEEMAKEKGYESWTAYMREFKAQKKKLQTETIDKTK